MRDQAPEAVGNTAQLPVPADAPVVTATPRDSSAPGDAPGPMLVTQYDPLRLCIYTTIAIIAWIVTPPLAVAGFGTIGVVGYWRARRRGLVSSRCLLGDTRIVIAYLGLAAAAGAAWTIRNLLL